MAGVHLVPPAERQDEEAFGDAGREPHAGDQPGVLVAGVAGGPVGSVFHIRAVERLQLPPPREEQQEPAPQPGDWAGAELRALLKRRPEHRKVQRNPINAMVFSGQSEFADHELDRAVGRLRGTAHQVQGDPGAAPWDQRQHRDHAAAAVQCLHEQAIPVGRVAQPAQCHGEAALTSGVTPGVGAGNGGGHLLLRDVPVPPDAHVKAASAGPGDGLAYPAHVRPGQFEVSGPQDRFVAQFDGVEAGVAICLRPLRTGPHHTRRPAVCLAQRQPRVDRLRPHPRIADGVAAGQADADLDPVGDGGPATVGEHHGFVAAGREVTQRVVLAVDLEQPADGGLVLAGERVVGPL